MNDAKLHQKFKMRMNTHVDNSVKSRKWCIYCTFLMNLELCSVAFA